MEFTFMQALVMLLIAAVIMAIVFGFAHTWLNPNLDIHTAKSVPAHLHAVKKKYGRTVVGAIRA